MLGVDGKGDPSFLQFFSSFVFMRHHFILYPAFFLLLSRECNFIDGFLFFPAELAVLYGLGCCGRDGQRKRSAHVISFCARFS